MGNSALICDFGLARVLNDGRSSSSQLAISPAYAAPECLKENQPSSTSDQYSLAITYCELRTGNLPFVSDSAAGVYEAHLSGNLDLSGLSDAEQNILRRATALNPSDRFPTTSGMVRELRHALQIQAGVDQRVTMVESGGQERSAPSSLPDPKGQQTVVVPIKADDTVRLSPAEATRRGHDSRITTAQGTSTKTATRSEPSGQFVNWKQNKVLIVSGIVVLGVVIAGFGLFRSDDGGEDVGQEDSSAETEEQETDLVTETSGTEPAKSANDAPKLELLSADSVSDSNDDGKTIVAGTGSPAKDAEAYFESGKKFHNQKKYAEAIVEFTKAIDRKPADAQLMYKLHNRRAQLDREAGGEENNQRALDDFNEVAKFAPDNRKKAFAYFARGMLLHEMQRLPEAISDFTKSIEVTPDEVYGYEGRAESYRARNLTGDKQRAAEDETRVRILKGEVPPNAA